MDSSNELPAVAGAVAAAGRVAAAIAPFAVFLEAFAVTHPAVGYAALNANVIDLALNRLDFGLQRGHFGLVRDRFKIFALELKTFQHHLLAQVKRVQLKSALLVAQGAGLGAIAAASLHAPPVFPGLGRAADDQCQCQCRQCYADFFHT